MTFDDLLDEILALLRHQGRVSYWALKRRFDLHDNDIAGLKDELITARRLAVDEEGKVLVWAGRVDPSPVPLPPSSPLVPQGEPAPSSPQFPEAERRQLTVLFCDLAESTRLATRLDLDDLREVVLAYQATCVEVLQRFDGYVAQYMGDGLLVYFGYPQAHEDDAQRAIRAGLEILDAMATLTARLAQRQGIRLAVRIGIHTGPVVVGSMGSGGRYEQLPLGETPNLAARLQSLAAPDTLAISDTTHRLVQGYFTCNDLGLHSLKGIEIPVRVYHTLPSAGRSATVLFRGGQVADGAGVRGTAPAAGTAPERPGTAPVGPLEPRSAFGLAGRGRHCPRTLRAQHRAP